MLLNLTTNGLKFTAEGGVSVELREYEDNPEQLRCTVHDTGRGIPEAAMPTLFEPFRRRQQAGDYAFSGSGLGLSICRELARLMRDCSCESPEDFLERLEDALESEELTLDDVRTMLADYNGGGT